MYLITKKIFAAIIYLSISFSFIACNKTNFSNPEEVISSYRKLMQEKEYDEIYEEYLSQKSDVN